MKQVLAELHSLINDLEDQGLTAEASSLQDVFLRVAEEAETDDLANDVKAILESHPVAKVLEEIAKQMGGDVAGAGDEDTQTSSFANVIDSGTPGIKQTTMNDPIVKKYVDLVARFKMDKEKALTKMNAELEASGQPSVSNIDNFVLNRRHEISQVNYEGPDKLKPTTREEVERMLAEQRKEMIEHNEGDWVTAPGSPTSR